MATSGSDDVEDVAMQSIQPNVDELIPLRYLGNRDSLDNSTRSEYQPYNDIDEGNPIINNAMTQNEIQARYFICETQSFASA